MNVNAPASRALAQMAAIFSDNHCSVIGVEEVPREETGKYGIVASEPVTDRLNRVTSIVEKPEPDVALRARSLRNSVRQMYEEDFQALMNNGGPYRMSNGVGDWRGIMGEEGS